MIYDIFLTLLHLKLFYFSFVTGCKKVGASWLVSSGFVDIMCIRIASMKEEKLATVFLNCVFSFVKDFTEIQATETIKVSNLASLILEDQDGPVS